MEALEQSKDENLSFEIKCSFLEMYSESVDDLLTSTSKNLQVTSFV